MASHYGPLDAMTRRRDASWEAFWAAIPAKAEHPVRVTMLEALRWIGEPLSPIELVDVLDGTVSMWEAAHHLSALESLDVVEPLEGAAGGETTRGDGFDTHYRLKASGVAR